MGAGMGMGGMVKAQTKKSKGAAQWVVLGIAVTLLSAYIVAGIIITAKMGQIYDLIITLSFYGFCAAISLFWSFYILHNNKPVLEIIKGINILLFVVPCLSIGGSWPLWVANVVLSIIYIKNPSKTNGKENTVLVFFVLSCFGLAIAITRHVLDPEGAMYLFNLAF